MAPKKSIKLPKYRMQKRKGKNLAFVELNGHRHYLGPHGSRESKQMYERLLAEWLENGKKPAINPSEITVVEVVARFWEYAQEHYRRADGTLTCEPNNLRQAAKPLKELYGQIPAKNFGPLALKAVRNKMIEKGWCRTNINKMVSRIKLMFKWAVENELIAPAVYHGLQAVPGLKHGRTKAPEAKPVMPVPDWIVDGTLENMTPTVRAMVQLQRFTGMRPGEVCLMRRRDIDISGKIWIYKPYQHKTQHHGHVRIVYLGPKAQQVLIPFMQISMDTYIFSPKRSEAERREKLHLQRKTPHNNGNFPGSNRKKKPKRSPGDYYTTTTYERAVKYACRQAFPEPSDVKKNKVKLNKWRKNHSWSPNQLRHNYATDIRKNFGLESAQILLGHSKADVTQIYAELDNARAIEIVAKIG